MDGERTLSTREVADLLGVSVRYVERQIAEGRLTAIEFRTGRRAMLRIRQSDLRAFGQRYMRLRRADDLP